MLPRRSLAPLAASLALFLAPWAGLAGCKTSTGGGTLSAGGAATSSTGGSTASSAGGGASTSSSGGAGGGGGTGGVSTGNSSASSSSGGGIGGGGVSASSGGPVCQTSNDCPGSDTACAMRSCLNGLCGTSFAAVGTNVPVPGDCLKNQCNGQGNIVSSPDPSDAPISGNTCVAGSCVGGVPTLTPLSGTACNQNGGSVCKNGSCIPAQCVIPADCPGQTDCTFASCNMGLCVLISNDLDCQSPPPCHGSPAFCTPQGCSYSAHQTGGQEACPGGLCFFGLCESCAMSCPAPSPCHGPADTCAMGVLSCHYPNAPVGTPCPGGTCDGNGSCL